MNKFSSYIDTDAIKEAYHEQMKIVFIYCAEDLAKGDVERFEKGVSLLNAAMETALDLLEKMGDEYDKSCEQTKTVPSVTP